MNDELHAPNDYWLPGAPDDKWREIEAEDGGRLIIFPGTGDDPHTHVEHLPPGARWPEPGHAGEDLRPYSVHVTDPGRYDVGKLFSAQSNLYWQTIEDRARETLRGAALQTSYEFTVEVDRSGAAFDLFMFGMTRAQHQLQHRLNVRWKYRIDPGQPEAARRYLHGNPERNLVPVIVTVDGRDIEALAETKPGATTFYPAHPKGK